MPFESTMIGVIITSGNESTFITVFGHKVNVVPSPDREADLTAIESASHSEKHTSDDGIIVSDGDIDSMDKAIDGTSETITRLGVVDGACVSSKSVASQVSALNPTQSPSQFPLLKQDPFVSVNISLQLAVPDELFPDPKLFSFVRTTEPCCTNALPGSSSLLVPIKQEFDSANCPLNNVTIAPPGAMLFENSVLSAKKVPLKLLIDECDT